MDVREEVARYKSGGCRFVDLSEEAKAVMLGEWREIRCGFKPDLTFHASGVSMERSRQAVLSQAHKFVTATSTPPVKVYRDRTNKYDEYAIVIEIPRVYDEVAGTWEVWEPVGFVPRGRCIHCDRTLTGPQMNRDDCPSCSGILFSKNDNGERVPVHEMVEFNKHVARLIDAGAVHFACDSIVVNENAGKSSNIGLVIALKIDYEKLNATN